MLDERKTAILRAVVSEYIATAQPVGSAHVAASTDLRVSPATVRNEMVVLEQDGYLIQPHTSAGRIPTDKAYRVFVDHLTAPSTLPAGKRQLVRDFFAQAHGELEAMLHDTSQLLASVTDYAGVVVGPPVDVATIRSAQLVSLSSRAALLVMVLSNGAVVKHAIDVGDDVGDERVAAASAHLAAHLTGRGVVDLAPPPATGDPATDGLVAAAFASCGQEPAPGDVFVGGTSQLASAFDAVEAVRRILRVLEQQFVVVGLLRDVLERGLSVSIGTEHGYQTLADCSIVVAPYEVEGEAAGTIAVLGPTRMNYPEAMAAVAVVSERLGRRLTEG
jgi:heat-inducible transcriptional repressor